MFSIIKLTSVIRLDCRLKSKKKTLSDKLYERTDIKHQYGHRKFVVKYFRFFKNISINFEMILNNMLLRRRIWFEQEHIH